MDNEQSENELTPEEQEMWDNIDVSGEFDNDNDIEVETESKEPENQIDDKPETAEQPETKDSEDEIDWNKTFRVKARGQEIDFSLGDLVHKLAPKALDYTQKLQKIAPYRKMISAVENEKLTTDDINLFIDMKKGNKDAIAKFVKNSNIDLMEIDDNNGDSYKPNDYGHNEAKQELDDTLAEIMRSPVKDRVVDIVSNVLDNRSQDVIAARPEMLKALEEDIRSKTYDIIAPEALRRQALDGAKRPIIEYYQKAAIEFNQYLKSDKYKEYLANERKTQENKQNQQRAARKNAVVSTPRTAAKVTDLLDDELDSLPTDEQYKEWLNKIGDSNY